MALGKALEFVRKAGNDPELRDFCHSAASKEELLEALGFHEGEFEDAINMELVKCQTYEEAEVVQQIKLWFSLL